MRITVFEQKIPSALLVPFEGRFVVPLVLRNSELVNEGLDELRDQFTWFCFFVPGGIAR